MLDAGLRLGEKIVTINLLPCLNPYYVGCWSQTQIMTNAQIISELS